MIPRSLFLLATLLMLASCKTPTINLETKEPLTVDINMRIDVYQYDTNKTPAQVKAESTNKPSPESLRRNRMADIQNLKNDRIIGEARDGLLSIRKDPGGDYGAFVRQIVREENADRMALMKAMAEEQKMSLEEVQKKQAELWRNRSFKDEWIEQPQPDGTWKWVPKPG